MKYWLIQNKRTGKYLDGDKWTAEKSNACLFASAEDAVNVTLERKMGKTTRLVEYRAPKPAPLTDVDQAAKVLYDKLALRAEEGIDVTDNEAASLLSLALAIKETVGAELVMETLAQYTVVMHE